MPSPQSKIINAVLRVGFKWTSRRAGEGDIARTVAVARKNFSISEPVGKLVPRGTTIVRTDDGALHGEWITARKIVPPSDVRDEHLVYYIHGGGFVACSMLTHRQLAIGLSKATRARVFLLDYTLAPESQFPGPLDECVAGYRALLERGYRPENIVIGGDSAGGNLTLATLLRLRDEGVPLPAGALCFSPWSDLTMSGPSIVSNAKADPFLEQRGFADIVKAYLGDHSPLDPYASPLFGDYRGLPPLLVQAGTTETLRDDSVRVVERAKRAGVDALLDLWDGVPHVWQAFPSLPETKKALKTVALFTERVWARTPSPDARLGATALAAR